jgi:hypothetical protein
MGLLLHAIVHSAGIQDRDGGISLLTTMKGLFPFLEWSYQPVASSGIGTPSTTTGAASPASKNSENTRSYPDQELSLVMLKFTKRSLRVEMLGSVCGLSNPII